MRETGPVLQFLQWFLSLDEPKQGNLKLTLIGLVVGLAIYQKPEVFGPWVEGLFAAAELSTWVIAMLATICVFNLMSHARQREHKLEEHVSSLRERITTLEGEVNKAREEYDLRVEQVRNEYRGVIDSIVAERDRCHSESRMYRTAVSRLVVVSAKQGAADEAEKIVDDLDGALMKAS